MKVAFVIAIDGPVASGKGTIAQLLSKKLDAIQIDTGSMYRAVALSCKEHGVDLTDRKEVLNLLPSMGVEIYADEVNRTSRVSLGSRNVSEQIRRPEIADASSITSHYPEVRAYLVAKQKQLIAELLSQNIRVVIEGRIVATEVVPDAEYKLFLTATTQERAKRRLAQYQQKGVEISPEKVLEDTIKRDERDADNLPINPESLGYHVIDTTGISEDQTMALIIEELQRRNLL
jgi:cytidylate kinase